MHCSFIVLSLAAVLALAQGCSHVQEVCTCNQQIVPQPRLTRVAHQIYDTPIVKVLNERAVGCAGSQNILLDHISSPIASSPVVSYIRSDPKIINDGVEVLSLPAADECADLNVLKSSVAHLDDMMIAGNHNINSLRRDIARLCGGRSDHVVMVQEAAPLINYRTASRSCGSSVLVNQPEVFTTGCAGANYVNVI